MSEETQIPATVLIVDDDEAVLELTTIFLTSRGYDVITTPHSIEANKLIKNHRPELVLLDYMLPHIDGLTLLKSIRGAYPDTYFIFLTGGGSTELAVEAMKAGAADYIAKPFKKDVLLDRIKSVLKIRSVEIMNRRLMKEIEGWNRELEQRVKEKAVELSKAYQQIVQAEKMAILGFLSTGMAHDIRNPLNTINLFVQILMNELEEDEKKVEYLNIISDNANRINLIVEKLLDSSKRPKYQIMPQEINDVVMNTVSMYEYQAFLQHVEMVTDLAVDIPQIEADYYELEQLFSNLIINSFHAMKNGGRIDIKTRYTDNNITIIIKDSGVGIPKEDLEKIFDPFFTTKKDIKGSGLGLNVVHRIVDSYGGAISVNSNVGEFTQFTIHLPLKSESAGLENLTA